MSIRPVFLRGIWGPDYSQSAVNFLFIHFNLEEYFMRENLPNVV